MTNVDQWANVKPGDKITVTIEVIVASVDRYDNACAGTKPPRPFTALTYAVGPSYERPAVYGGGSRPDIFTLEVPDYDSPDVTVEVSRDSQPEPPEIFPGTHAALDSLTIRTEASAS